MEMSGFEAPLVAAGSRLLGTLAAEAIRRLTRNWSFRWSVWLRVRKGSVHCLHPAVIHPAASRSTRRPRGGPMAALDTGKAAPTTTNLSDMYRGVFITAFISADVVAAADADLSCPPLPVGNPQRNALVFF